MTDDELIKLVEEKAPEELSFEEILAIRARLPESPELQRLLAGRMQMDQYLCDALGRVHVTADQILARAGHRGGGPPSAFAPLGLIPALMVAAFLGAVVYRAWYTPPAAQLASAVVSPADEHAAAPAQQTTIDPPEGLPAGGDGPASEPPSQRASDPASVTGGHAASEVAVETEPPKQEPPTTKQPQPEPKKPRLSPPKQAPGPEKPPRPPEPWENEQQLFAAVLPWQDVVYRDFSADQAPLKANDLKRWVQAAPGQRHQIRDEREAPMIQGLVKLRAPWADHAVLRLTVRPHHGFQFHVWSGRRGATLRHYESVRQFCGWAGYQTERNGASALPSGYALAGIDYARHWQMRPASNAPDLTLDLRYENGALLLCRGDLRLVAVPLAGPPEEIYFDGTLQVRELRMLRSTPLPESAPDERPIGLDVERPAELAWLTRLPQDAVLNQATDGSVELATAGKSPLAWAAIGLATDELQEVLLEIENPSPASGVYLGDAEGNPLYGTHFLIDTDTQRLATRILPMGDGRTARSETFDRWPAAYLPERFWVKLFYLGNFLRCAVSVDGVHWGELEGREHNAGKPIGSVGMYVSSEEPVRRIKLRRIQTRRFPRIAALADPELVAQAPVAFEKHSRKWMEQAAAEMPDGLSTPRDAESASGTPTDAWLTACALRSLASGAPDPLAGWLARQLVASGLRAGRPLEERIALLDEVLTVADLRHQDANRLGLAGLLDDCDRIGIELFRQGQSDPFARVGKRALQVANWNRHPRPPISERLARIEIVGHASSGDWRQVYRLATELSHYNETSLAPLVSWATAMSQRHVPELAAGGRVAVDHRWRHPLVIELSKEGFNVLAEFDSALANDAWDDACQIVAAARSAESFGLLPDPRDGNYWVSFPLAVANAVQLHPQLLDTMQTRYGPLAELRVREAIGQGDAARLEAATVQFHGTLAAARAHLWLADRALSSGDFTRAMRHCRLAETPAALPILADITARRRLAAAMLGQSLGERASQPVQIGDRRLLPAQFEALLDDVLRHNQRGLSGGSAIGQGVDPRLPAPIVTALKPEETIKLERPRPARLEQMPEGLRRQGVDWIARLTGVATSGERAYLSDGSIVACYDLERKELKWQKVLAGGQGRRRQRTEAAPAPMRPVLLGDRMYLRGGGQSGIQLFCLQTDQGDVVWKAGIPDDHDLVSDPLIVGGEVLALATQEESREVSLSLLAFDATSGDLLRQARLGLFGQSWNEHASCALSWTGDGIVAVTGGCVLCFDTEGEVRWLRRQTWLPTAQMPDWIRQSPEPPLLVDGSGSLLYVVQPGVPALDCIELDSGRLRFSAVLPEVRRVAGLAGGRLIAEVDDGLVALDAATGQILWQHRAGDLVTSQLCGEPGGIVYVRRITADESGRERKSLQFVWLDPASGRPKASHRTQLSGERPVIGPFFKSRKHFWALAGSGPNDYQRTVVRLAPDGAAAGPPQDLLEGPAWPELNPSAE